MMSPDSEQPHVTSELPEVPQIPPEQPEQPVVEPMVEVQPPQEVESAPLPAEPEVAQPIDIPIPIEELPSVDEPPQPIPVQTQAPATPNDVFSQPVQDFATSPATPFSSPVTPKKKRGLLVGRIVGGVVLIAALAIVLYVVLFSVTKIADTDLVSSTTDGTSYLRPKQWQSITVSSIAGYGDKKGKNDTSTGAIFVTKKSYVASGIKSATTTELEEFRNSVISSMTLTSGGQVAQDTGSCTSVQDVTVMKSTVVTTKMVGVLRIDATCKRDDGTFKIAIYTTLGNDGYLRSITLMSTESLWNKNEAVFNKMLNSADQI